MKKRILVLAGLLFVSLLFGCSAKEGAEAAGALRDERTAKQIAVRMVLKEFSAEDQADVEAYAKEIGEMSEDEFDTFINGLVNATDRHNDWRVLQQNLSLMGVEMELPERPYDGENAKYLLESFSVKRANQSVQHLFFHLYSTWFETDAGTTDQISLSFDAEKLEYASSYSSDSIAKLSDSSQPEKGEIVFDYEDRTATDPVPFDGDDRVGEVLVGVRVEPLVTGEEVQYSGVLLHTSVGKEDEQFAVNDTVCLP